MYGCLRVIQLPTDVTLVTMLVVIRTELYTSASRYSNLTTGTNHHGHFISVITDKLQQRHQSLGVLGPLVKSFFAVLYGIIHNCR